ncbi:hypothetical protein BLA29_000493 [Euroglyphus maynei]|uniref:Uncharacterized protein n=1 Tax=Euroglyphus maynei TaxID=6958 RepID=A0A1Y3B2K3_EURMA|nr:hypothetical protein BLA29_000493 [Euroglyphus maynei]
MIDQSNRAGSAGSAYSPDPNMGYLMDSSQQFRTPGKYCCFSQSIFRCWSQKIHLIIRGLLLLGIQGCTEGSIAAMAGYSPSAINQAQLRSQQMLLPGHTHAAAMMIGHTIGHSGITQSSPYDSSGHHIMDIHAS